MVKRHFNYYIPGIKHNLALWIIGFSVLFGNITLAQNEVNISLRILPPYSPRISDYADNPQKTLLTLRNLTDVPLSFYLGGTITGENGIELRTNPDFRSGQILRLESLEVLTLDGNAIRNLFEVEQLVLSGITRNELIRGNGLPEGIYTICLQAYDAQTGAKLSADEPLGCSNPINITNLEPPVLINPFCGEDTISAFNPQNIVFTWSLPPGAPPDIEYYLTLVELQDPRRNPNDAFLSSTQPVFFEEKVTGNAFLYGPSQPPLTEGRRYAYAITAKDPQNRVVFRNEGRSEICSFVYKPSPTGIVISKTPTNEVSRELVKVHTIPRTTITGRLVWSFRKSELTLEALAGPVSVATASGGILQSALIDPNYSMQNSQVVKDKILGANSSQSVLASYANEKPAVLQNNQAMVNRLFVSKPSGPALSVPVFGGTGTSGASVGSVIRKADLNSSAIISQLADSRDEFPLSNATVKIVTGGLIGDARTLGVVKTDQDGNFSLDFVNPNYSSNSSSKFNYVTVMVDDEHFLFELKKVYLNNPDQQEVNLGTIHGLAKSYRLLTVVKDADDILVVPEGVKVDVYRPSHWYAENPALKREGSLPGDSREEEIINGVSMTKVASGSGSSAFSKLFFNKKGFADQYYVRVTAPGYNTLIAPLIVAPQGDYENGIVEITQNYKIAGKLPEVHGVVMRSDNNAPMAGVTVILKKAPKTPEISVTSTVTADKLLSSTYNYGMTAKSGGGPSQSVSIPLAGSVKTELMSQLTRVSTAGGGVSSASSINVQTGRIFFGEAVSGALPPQGGTVGGAYGSGAGSRGNIANSVITEITEDTYFNMIQAVPKQGQTYASVVTDQDGKYHIGNIKPDEEDYQILVVGKGIKTNEPNTIKLNAKGLNEERDLYVNMNLVEVKGRAVNDKGEGLNNVSVRWKSGGDPVNSEADGYFKIMGVPGADVLSLHKTGHNDSDTTIILASANPQDIGTITLYRLVGKLLVKVQDKANSNPIVNATVIVGNDELASNTNNRGETYFEGAVGGNISIRVRGPADQDYIPTLPEIISVSYKGDTTRITIELALGARANGVIRNNGSPVSGATVRVDGRDDLFATSGNDGSYILRGIPQDEFTLKAVKSGMIGDSASRNFSEGSQTIDFNLSSSSFDIASLLGFPIEVESFSESAMTITGAFVNMPGNPLFKTLSDARLPFYNIKVKQTGVRIEPVSGEVQTDVTELRLKVYNFLPVIAKNPTGIVIKKAGTDPDKGNLVAKVEIDYSSLSGNLNGWVFQTAESQFLKTASSATPEMVVFTSSAGLPYSQDSLMLGSQGAQQMKLYGFEVSLNLGKSSLKMDGLHLQGNVKLNGIPLLTSAELNLSHLWIAPDGSVKDAVIHMGTEAKIDLAGWAFSITDAKFGETGFRFNGKLEIAIPSSPKSTLTFSNLSASVDQLFGGEFTLPEEGLNVFNIVSFKTAPMSKIVFAQIPNSNIYAVSGNAQVALPKYIDKTLDIKKFIVQTDGRFMAMVPANYKADFFGLAKFEINNIAFRNLSGSPEIDVSGGMTLSAIPFITASAGGISFGTGGKVSVEKINLGFSLASVAEVKVGIGFKDTPEVKGFEGSGSLRVGSTPFGGSISFHYYKTSSSDIEFGAEFMANTPPIVLSPVTTIAKVGGGFGYSYDAAAGKKKYRITVRGAMSVAPGTDLLVALDPLEVTVESGPVIKGYTAITVVGQRIANAKLLIDIPNTLFNVEAQFGVGFLQDIGVKNEGGSILVISGKPNDAYWMVGAYFRIDVLGLIQNNGYMAAGWNLNIDAHPELMSYTGFIPMDFRSSGTTLNGVHFKAMSHFGLTRENAACGNIAGVAGGCVWFFNHADAVINANLVMRKLGIMVGTAWGGGAEVQIAGQNIAGASIGAGVTVAGSYSPTDGWYFNGNGNAHLSAWFGSCTDACETKICWGGCFNACLVGCEICPIPVGGKICVNPGLNVSYSSKRGANVSIDL